MRCEGNSGLEAVQTDWVPLVSSFMIAINTRMF